jgi:formylglycine-generating enzyme required for sulfatase activity
MMTKRSLRYPGVRPFETHEKHLFFGRSRDIEELYDLLLLERLIVLFAKSGYGKSSLLKAGIIPKFTDPRAPESRQYRPIEIRFGTYVPGKSATPLETVVKALEPLPTQKDAVFLATGTPAIRLWHHFKMRQAPTPEGTGAGNSPGSGRFFLIFDQFEEFFSYPEADQAQFRAEIAELLYEEIPQDVRLAARAGTREQRAFLATPFDAKVLFSIRADRLSLLDGMKDRLPAILNKRFELQALDERQAREAIVMPAALPPELLGTGAGESFTYSTDALEKMLRELSGKDAAGRGRIEAFQLQIVCASIEKRVRERGLTTVTAADLPDFGNVYEDYYQDRIGELPPGEQLAARRVLEDGLLLVDTQTGDARRLSRDSVELAQSLGVSQELLKNLERTYLLRRELNTLGGYNYEISHDTLIGPMLKSRKAREATLEQQRQEQERIEALRRAKEAEAKALEEAERRAEAERLQHAAEKAKRRANIFALGVGVLAILAGIAFFVAKQQRANAVAARIAADSSATVAIEQRRLADSSAIVAHQQEMRADSQKTIALENAEAARIALERMLRANDNLVEQALRDAKTDITALRYESARSKLHNAAALGRKKPQIANALLEIVYFFNESGQKSEAQEELTRAATLLGKTANLAKGDRAALRTALQALASARFGELEARYYPVLVPVKGRAGLSDFKLAKTETTVWQYNLYLQAQGKNMLDETVIKRPGWGWAGDNPVVFVSWYDAVQYANWLSAQRGLTPAYTIDQEQQDTDNINTSTADPLKWTVTLRENANGYRLPRSAEWEYAALGGPNQTSFDYAGSNRPDEVAWYGANSQKRTRAVATKKPNSLGLYDLTGNAWEWCWEWDAESFGRSRVVRGGGWGNLESTIRVGDAGKRTPGSQADMYGFRVAGAAGI